MKSNIILIWWYSPSLKPVQLSSEGVFHRPLHSAPVIRRPLQTSEGIHVLAYRYVWRRAGNLKHVIPGWRWLVQPIVGIERHLVKTWWVHKYKNRNICYVIKWIPKHYRVLWPRNNIFQFRFEGGEGEALLWDIYTSASTTLANPWVT